MRQSSTLVYFLLFVVAIGAYYFINNREEPADIAVTIEAEEVVTYLFNAEDGVPNGIRLESKGGDVFEVARNADGAWELIRPLEASAEQGAVEATASGLTTLRIEETIPGLDLEIVGLKDAEYTLIVQFKDNVERTAKIGVITPTENGYYVLTPDGDVVIISKYLIDPLLGLLTNPPYLETPTPSPTATETPLPATVDPASPTPSTTTPQP